MRIRILIADDHVVVRQGIKTILNSLGEQHHVVAEAEDGREVLQLMDIHDVDVTILDISMPKLNGPAFKTASAGQGRHLEHVR